MTDPDSPLRIYGARYFTTRTITDLDVLAERILLALPMLTGPDVVPPGAEFGIHIVANTLLRLQVGGLQDDWTFADSVSHRYSKPALELASYLNLILESYNWIDPRRPTSRRFFCAVYLLSEADYKNDAVWMPGVTRL